MESGSRVRLDQHQGTRRYARAVRAAGLFLAVALAPAVQAQEVNGIYTDSTTKDLGEITGHEKLKGIKFRGWVEGYYVWNGNDVSAALANENQPASAVKSRDLTIEGRTFDVHHNSFSLDLAELEIEKVPGRGDVGFKVDVAFADVQDIIVDTIKSVSPTGVSDFDKVFQHASISYLAPVGSGLRFDFGKFVTHIGGETIESIKNRNFSRTFFYTYAIPFQDSGLRVNYTFSPKVYGELYLLNGWNVTSDNNKGKSYGLSLGLTPSSKVTIYANYLGGPERNGNDDDWRHLGDFQVMLVPSSKLQFMLNVDVAVDKNALSVSVPAGQAPRFADAKWKGVTLVARGNMNGRFFPTGRVEYYDDSDGFTTGVAQKLWGFTFTGDYKLLKEGFANVLVRPEVRYDKSDSLFFSRKDAFRSEKHQFTAGFGVVAYF